MKKKALEEKDNDRNKIPKKKPDESPTRSPNPMQRSPMKKPA